MADNKQSTLGLGGYDPVSYFREGRPRPGNYDYKTKHDGLTYCFFNQENLNQFLKKPDSFTPQFGSHCAFSMGLFGGRRPGDPQIWKIVDGKLYLTAGYFTSKIWEFMPFLISRGHANYTSRKRR